MYKARSTMSEYFKYLRQMLAIAGESFEEELRCLGFSVTQLNPMEVLEALINTQQCLGCDFSKEEFKEGSIGNLLIPEDFKFTKSVSMQNHYQLLTFLLQLFLAFVSRPQL